jgi:transcriptional regulator with XRE-family HTH domain
MALGASERKPSPAGHRLGAELRRLREERGMSGEGVAMRMKWSPSKVSRTERARSCIKPHDVQKLTVLYRLPPDQAEALVEMATRAWAEASTEEVARFEAVEVLAWAPVTVPLLLRAEGYYRAVFAVEKQIMPMSPGMIRDAVHRNDLWKDRLLDKNPIQVRAVLDESVLHRRFGDRQVMTDQLRCLAELSELGNIDLRVLPLDAGGPSHLPPYTCTRYHGDDDLVAVDEVLLATMSECDPWQLESERAAWLHTVAFSLLAAAAEPAADRLKAALADWS